MTVVTQLYGDNPCVPNWQRGWNYEPGGTIDVSGNDYFKAGQQITIISTLWETVAVLKLLIKLRFSIGYLRIILSLL
jgi:hypothetical protein